ncbi:protein UXT [Alligator mississippiensis]|uniref:Protein UXT n=1 Tax=Alligator mississippiensis TaxID=8496 RepID=A0A151MYJ8_ALLMI|nr:protein UXT [Alligator mississippiensis]
MSSSGSRIYQALSRRRSTWAATSTSALRCQTHRGLLLSQLSETLTKDSAKIKANIRLVLEGLRELQGLKDLPEELWGNVLL